MNVHPSAARTDNPESDDVTAAILESTVAAAVIEIPTRLASTQSEKNRALTGPAGPNGAPAQLPAATASDESRELASARIFSTTMLTALACHTKKNHAQSALVLALIEIGVLGPAVLLPAAMQSELANEATLAMPDKSLTLNPAICLLAAILFPGQSGPAARLLVLWAPALAHILGPATTKLTLSRLKRAMPAMEITHSGRRGTSALKLALAARNHASENTPAAFETPVASLTSLLRHKLAALKATGPATQNTQPALKLAKVDS